jgi:hypothetical protein
MIDEMDDAISHRRLRDYMHSKRKSAPELDTDTDTPAPDTPAHGSPAADMLVTETSATDSPKADNTFVGPHRMAFMPAELDLWARIVSALESIAQSLESLAKSMERMSHAE